jgi:hypothetical protein
MAANNSTHTLSSANESNTNTSNVSHKVQINRDGLNELSLREKYSFQKFKADNVGRSTIRYMKKNYKPSRECTKRYIINRLPIIDWLFRNYNVREYLLKDIVTGLTIGVVQIPQSMAYAMMADLPPVNGLYVAFITVMVYFFLGTSRHLSLGNN